MAETFSYDVIWYLCAVARKHKLKKEDEPRVPRSLFDRPSSLLRRDAKMVKLKQSGALKASAAAMSSQGLLQRQSGGDSAVGVEPVEWLIHEDWALLQVCTNISPALWILLSKIM